MLSLVLAAALQAAPQAVPTVLVRMTPRMHVDGSALPLQNCAAGPSQVAHFVVGDQAIQLRADLVHQFLPRTLSAAGPPPHDFATTEFMMAANVGCPEASTPVASVLVDSPTIALPRGVQFRTGSFMSGEELVQARDRGQCPTVGEFVRCTALVGDPRQRKEVTLLIAPSETARDGRPLFAACENVDDRVICSVRGGRGGLRYQADLADDSPSLEEIRAADEAVTEMLDRRY